MIEHTKHELAVGVFVLLGATALAYLSLSLGAIEIAPRRYQLHARFASAGDLKRGAVVKLAGVKVGEVRAIGLVEYAAEVLLSIDRDVKLPADTIASIRTLGLLGDSYVSLSPGAADTDLADGGRLQETRAPVDLLDLLSKFLFGGGNGGAGAASGGGPTGGAPKE
jgi:phospholipid/cholesterol/gamma-HCH transport system substrate-binding protein